MLLVPVKDVDWSEAEAKYVRIHVRENSYLIRDSIAAVEARKSPPKPRCISSTRRMFVVVLHGGTRLTMSRRHRARVREISGLDV